MNIVDVTADNAQQYVIDASFQQLVIVDFWADWCEPCKNLMPVLEKIAGEYPEHLLLAKINADEQQMLAAQFGVRSLPTVMFVKEGQPVDGFTGAKTEPEIRELLQNYLPQPWEASLNRARALMEEGDAADALTHYREALEISGHRPEIASQTAICYAELGRVEEAEQLLEPIKLADQDAYYQQALAAVELKKQAGDSAELEQLKAEHEQKPEDLDTAYRLAMQYHAEGQQRPALELLMDIFKRDRQFQDGAARKAITDIIATLGKGDPLAVEFQRKLFTLLY